MAIVFLEQKSKKKYFYLGAGIVIVILLIFVVMHFRNQEILPIVQTVNPQKITVDWSVFDNPLLQKLDSPLQVPQISTMPTRGNPFEEFIFPTSTPTLTPSVLTPSQ